MKLADYGYLLTIYFYGEGNNSNPRIKHIMRKVRSLLIVSYEVSKILVPLLDPTSTYRSFRNKALEWAGWSI